MTDAEAIQIIEDHFEDHGAWDAKGLWAKLRAAVSTSTESETDHA